MKRRMLIGCVILLLAAGCGGGQPVRTQPPTVTPEPAAATEASGGASSPQALLPTAAMPTATAMFTPDTAITISTLAVTPTPGPPHVLLTAARHMDNGNYRAASATYEQILSQGPDALRPDAEFGLGEVSLRMGDYAGAVERLGALVDAYPTQAASARTAWAYFLRADAYFALGELDAAIDDYGRYLALRPGRIDSYVYGRMGDMQATLGRWDEALASYLAALDAGREPEGMQRLREEVAAIYQMRGDLNAVAAQYELILASAPDREYRADVMYRLAETWLALGRRDDAYTLFYRLFEEYAETPQAFNAMVALSEAGRPTNAYQQGLVSYFNADYQGALDAFYAHLVASPGGQDAPVLHMYVGLAQRALVATDAAGATFQEMLDQYPAHPLASQAMLMQGRVRFEAGDPAGAAQRYIQVAETYPGSAEAVEALWRAGYLYETALADTERAMATYEILGASYPDAAPARDGLWRASRLARGLGDNARAERLLDMLANSGAGEMPAKGALWLGKLRMERNDAGGARAAWTLGAEASPDEYYGLRCADMLVGRRPFQPPAAYQFEFDEAQAVAEAEAWLVSAFGLEVEQLPLWPLSDDLSADPRLVRGEELWQLGWYEPARAEFNALREAYAADPLALYRLAVYFRAVGSYRVSIEAAATLINMARANTLDAPPFIARLRFPAYYDDLVLTNAALNGVDPLYTYAMIRLESLFDGFALSYADAYGLMQIIPATGQHIADQLNWTDFTPEMLYYPHVSVTFGVFHLAELMGILGGDPYAVLAGYNAGPGRASGWLDQSGDDPDLFIEAVDIDQTERYIKFIYESYAIYRALYGVE